MKGRTAVICLFIVALTYVNYCIINEYNDTYTIKPLDSQTINNKKLRCFHYFSNGIYGKYTNRSCGRFEREYLNIKLGRSKFVFYSMLLNMFILVISVMFIAVVFS